MEDVVKVAQSLGCKRASDRQALVELFDAKFSEALKTVGKQFDFSELYTNRVRFREEILDIIGTDLSGSHPISFVVPVGDVGTTDSGRDMGTRPADVIRADGEVKLDKNGKMQCTSCHDPHSDTYYVEGRVPRFWVKPTVEEVCLACHVPR